MGCFILVPDLVRWKILVGFQANINMRKESNYGAKNVKMKSSKKSFHGRSTFKWKVAF